MKKYLFLLIYFSLFTVINASAGSELRTTNNELRTTNYELIKQANLEYSKQNYDKAIEQYKKVIGNGYASYELYYNLANACFKANQLPSAILYYEKAKKLNPSDEDLNFNIKVANSRIVDKIDVIPELFIKKWSNSLVSYFSADVWGKITVAAFFLFFVLLLIYLLGKTLLLRKVAFWLSVLLFIISVSAFFFARIQFNELNKVKEAVVFTPTLNVKSTPDQSSIDLFIIHEGLKVKIIDQVNDWYEIRIPNGSVGWLKTTDVEII